MHVPVLHSQPQAVH